MKAYVLEWPMHEGKSLGARGMWNVLWRLGVHPRDCRVDQVPDPAGSGLWVALHEMGDHIPPRRRARMDSGAFELKSSETAPKTRCGKVPWRMGAHTAFEEGLRRTFERYLEERSAPI